jgi:hypothetical protein
MIVSCRDVPCSGRRNLEKLEHKGKSSLMIVSIRFPDRLPHFRDLPLFPGLSYNLFGETSQGNIMERAVGVIGLGIMGGAIARNLRERGWRVVGVDVDAGRRSALAADEPAPMRVSTWDKDMHVIDEFAKGLGVQTPCFDASKPVYDEALRMGLGELDTAAVCKVIAAQSGLVRGDHGEGKCAA